MMQPLRILQPLLVLAAAIASTSAAVPVLALPTASAAPTTSAASSLAPPQADGRVVVVGFDGADWRTTERMMAEGQLPNLAALAQEGTAGPLVSTHPAESAAGWAAINTGANPAANGVPSFVRRAIDAERGAVNPDWGHIRPASGDVSEMDTGGWIGLFLEHGRSTVALGAFVLVLLVFFVALRFVLRAGTLVAGLISVLLGGGAAFGAWTVGADVPEEIPDVWSNQVRLDGFWIHAARAGADSVALDAALAFDRPGADGARTLYGLGLPDLRGGTNGEWFLYTTDPLAGGRPPIGFVDSSGSGTGTTFRVDWKDDRIETSVYGPLDFVERQRARARVEELTQKLDDTDTGFNDAKELRKERTELARMLVEMGDRELHEKLGLSGSLPKANARNKHRASVPLVVERAGEGAYGITIAGATQRVTSGGWSDYYEVRFDLAPLVKAHALTRVRVVKDEPFELYVDTLHIDPRNQPFWQPVTEPRSFGAELAELNGGPFESLGWGCLTNQMKDRALPVEVFLEDVEFTLAYRRRLTLEMLDKSDWRLLFSVFTTTDRIQHIMYRHHDPLHPQHDPEEAGRVVTFLDEEMPLKDVVPAIYREMDEVVGEIRAKLASDDTLMLCADHGFTSYRRGMVVNNWLADEGFLALKPEASRGTQSLGAAVDWTRTRAYSLGLGMVFVNLEGREPGGIVKREEVDELLAEIAARFEAATDAENGGASVGRKATVLKGLYEGPEAWGTAEYPCADLMLGFDEFYRVDWSSVGGTVVLAQGDDGSVGIGEIYKDNTSPWSGDHASNDPNLVTGIFFSSRKAKTADGSPFSVMDIAPTALERLGLPLPEDFERPPLVFE